MRQPTFLFWSFFSLFFFFCQNSPVLFFVSTASCPSFSCSQEVRNHENAFQAKYENIQDSCKNNFTWEASLMLVCPCQLYFHIYVFVSLTKMCWKLLASLARFFFPFFCLFLFFLIFPSWTCSTLVSFGEMSNTFRNNNYGENKQTNQKPVGKQACFFVTQLRPNPSMTFPVWILTSLWINTFNTLKCKELKQSWGQSKQTEHVQMKIECQESLCFFKCD